MNKESLEISRLPKLSADLMISIKDFTNWQKNEEKKRKRPQVTTFQMPMRMMRADF
jgi:hypothetical protein